MTASASADATVYEKRLEEFRRMSPHSDSPITRYFVKNFSEPRMYHIKDMPHDIIVDPNDHPLTFIFHFLKCVPPSDYDDLGVHHVLAYLMHLYDWDMIFDEPDWDNLMGGMVYVIRLLLVIINRVDCNTLRHGHPDLSYCLHVLSEMSTTYHARAMASASYSIDENPLIIFLDYDASDSMSMSQFFGRSMISPYFFGVISNALPDSMLFDMYIPGTNGREPIDTLYHINGSLLSTPITYMVRYLYVIFMRDDNRAEYLIEDWMKWVVETIPPTGFLDMVIHHNDSYATVVLHAIVRFMLSCSSSDNDKDESDILLGMMFSQLITHTFIKELFKSDKFHHLYDIIETNSAHPTVDPDTSEVYLQYTTLRTIMIDGNALPDTMELLTPTQTT